VNSVALSGADQADYTLTDPSASGPVGIIDPKALTLGAVADTMVYDGGVLAPAPRPPMSASFGRYDLEPHRELREQERRFGKPSPSTRATRCRTATTAGNYTVTKTTASGTITSGVPDPGGGGAIR